MKNSKKYLFIFSLLIGLTFGIQSVIAFDLDPGGGGSTGTSGTDHVKADFNFKLTFTDDTFGTNYVTYDVDLDVKYDYYQNNNYYSFIYKYYDYDIELDEDYPGAVFVSRDPYINYIFKIGNQLQFSRYITDPTINGYDSLFIQRDSSHYIHYHSQALYTVQFGPGTTKANIDFSSTTNWDSFEGTFIVKVKLEDNTFKTRTFNPFNGDDFTDFDDFVKNVKNYLLDVLLEQLLGDTHLITIDLLVYNYGTDPSDTVVYLDIEDLGSIH